MKKKRIKEILPILLLIAILVMKVVAIRTSTVRGTSMYPALKDQDDVIIETLSSYADKYKRGEIIVFHPFQDSDELFVKRIIGLPGETVEIKQKKVFVNGTLLKEKYLPKNIPTTPSMKVVVPKGHVFVLGDNRQNSADSRELGTIAMSRIRGHVLFNYRLFP